jgi:hypothetical protein
MRSGPWSHPTSSVNRPPVDLDAVQDAEEVQVGAARIRRAGVEV